ncbi:MAG TPA: flagellar basal-body MS-ring/collar protein FliF [Planctomycetota bacterium]|nr:flagellar basal-body MS-ring/collar protein FliF [Planctomycetota bacterium]
MSKIWQQLRAIWGRLEVSQRATIVLVLIGAIAAAAGLSYAASRPDYRMLVSDLGKGQVAEIVAYLDSTQVKYQLADRDSTILVPGKDLYRLRNELAERELLSDGSKGFEILSKSNMWDSTFTEHKTYDRAVAGELERSFRELAGVRSARVLIDRPQPSPFVGDDSAKPKASIKLDMASGKRLTDRQVAGVLRLTAGAIAGLQPERVEIMDNHGLLTPAAPDSSAMMAQTTLEAEAARDAYLTRKAQEQLDAVLGTGRSMVKVATKLDFTKRSTATSDPTKSVLLKENTSTTDEKTPIQPAGGVAGTQPNVEGAPAGGGGAAQIGSKTSEETKNEYVVGKSTTTQEDEIGRVTAMSVSILLDFKSTQVAKKDDKGQPTKEMEEQRLEYTEVEKQRFRDLVLNAIGYNAAKGMQLKAEAADKVEARFSATVQSMELYREPVAAVAQAGVTIPGLPGGMIDWVGYGLAGLVAIVLLMVARGQLKRSHQAWAQAEAKARQDDEERKSKSKVDTGKVDEGKAEEDNRARRMELKDQIKKRVMDDPASAAQIVRRWLYES